MTVFEPRTSGIGSDRSTNWATTTAQIPLLLDIHWTSPYERTRYFIYWKLYLFTMFGCEEEYYSKICPALISNGRLTLINCLKASGTLHESFRARSCRSRGTPSSLLLYMMYWSPSGTVHPFVKTGRVDHKTISDWTKNFFFRVWSHTKCHSFVLLRSCKTGQTNATKIIDKTTHLRNVSLVAIGRDWWSSYQEVMSST